MTWSYDHNLILEKDQVRWLVGDTDSTDQLAQNEEITFALNEAGSVYGAAALVCEAIATKYAREADLKEVGDLKLRYQERVSNFRALAERLRTSGTRTNSRIYAGGISVADKRIDEANTDRVPPRFRRDLHETTHPDGATYLTDEQDV